MRGRLARYATRVFAQTGCQLSKNCCFPRLRPECYYNCRNNDRHPGAQHIGAKRFRSRSASLFPLLLLNPSQIRLPEETLVVIYYRHLFHFCFSHYLLGFVNRLVFELLQRYFIFWGSPSSSVLTRQILFHGTGESSPSEVFRIEWPNE